MQDYRKALTQLFVACISLAILYVQSLLNCAFITNC
jgi:hypothetical protein